MSSPNLNLQQLKNSMEFYKDFDRNSYFKEIENLLQNKNILDNSLAESLLFELIFKFNYYCSFDEISKFFSIISNNNNFNTREIKFISFYKE